MAFSLLVLLLGVGIGIILGTIPMLAGCGNAQSNQTQRKEQ